MGTAMQERDITATLVARALAIRYASLPQWVRNLAGQCLIDWFAVAIAGAPDRLVQLLLDEARAEGGHPVASVPGHRDRVTRNQAALINGTMSHVLDYDDVNLNING
ncbi:MAG: MmgE/PrpD family protein, partial [Betaproteobacteria bacterium]|nr:MmgE/PrpD family protein [Betaproteobacteria bacterium]